LFNCPIFAPLPEGVKRREEAALKGGYFLLATIPAKRSSIPLRTYSLNKTIQKQMV